MMRDDRITYRAMHELALEVLGNDGIIRRSEHMMFESRSDMLKWMRANEDAGYYSMWATTVEISEVVWREDNAPKMRPFTRHMPGE